MVSYRQIIDFNLSLFSVIPHNLSWSIEFNKLTWDFAVSTALTHNIPHSKPTENGRQVVETKTPCCGTSRWYFSHPLFTSLRVNQWRSAHVGFPRTLANIRNVMFITSTFRMPKFIFQKQYMSHSQNTLANTNIRPPNYKREVCGLRTHEISPAKNRASLYLCL